MPSGRWPLSRRSTTGQRRNTGRNGLRSVKRSTSWRPSPRACRSKTSRPGCAECFGSCTPRWLSGAFNAITVGKSDSGLHLFRGYDLHAGVFDFSPVRVLPVEEFFLLDGGFCDATPLAKTKLKVISLNRGNRVRDLSPLAGLPLTSLNFAVQPI